METKMTRSSKNTNNGKSTRTKESDQTNDKTACVGVATGASDAVSEVHFSNKSRQTNQKINIAMQQNANKKVKHTDNDYYNKSHPHTKTRTPSAATSMTQISPFKSPKPSNTTRQLKCQGNNVISPYLNTKYQSTKMPHYKKLLMSTSTTASIVSPLKSPKKTTTIQTPLAISIPLT